MSEVDHELLQAVLSIIISVVVPALAYFVASWLKAQARLIGMKMSNEERKFVESMVYSMVQAAEQYDLAGIVKRSGAQKKAWVVVRVQDKLDELGIKWDANMLADLVESKIIEGAAQAWPSDAEPTTGTDDTNRWREII
jgi:hypothetical protein